MRWRGRWQSVPPATSLDLQDRPPHHLTDQTHAHTHTHTHIVMHTDEHVHKHSDVLNTYWTLDMIAVVRKYGEKKKHIRVKQKVQYFSTLVWVEIWKTPEIRHLFNVYSITAGM